MTRAFTLRFQFREYWCTALVTLKEGGYNLSFIVKYLDNLSKDLVQGGLLYFSLAEGVIKPTELSASETDMVYCTTEAITGYLQNNYSFI